MFDPALVEAWATASIGIDGKSAGQVNDVLSKVQKMPEASSVGLAVKKTTGKGSTPPDLPKSDAAENKPKKPTKTSTWFLGSLSFFTGKIEDTVDQQNQGHEPKSVPLQDVASFSRAGK